MTRYRCDMRTEILTIYLALAHEISASIALVSVVCGIFSDTKSQSGLYSCCNVERGRKLLDVR